MTAPDIMAELDSAAGLDAEPPRKENPVTKLASAMRDNFRMVHEAGRWYAVPLDSARGEGIGAPPGIAISRAELRRIIVRYGRAEKIAVVTGTMADTVLLQLEADAFDGRETELALRFHHEPGRVVLDLGQPGPAGKCVIITANGWAAGPVPAGVTFRRSHAIRPLPEPKQQPGVTMASLAGVLALDPDGGAFRCMAGWVAGLAFAGDDRPGLLLTGAPGSAKSTRLRLAASVAEPSGTDALGGAFGRNHGDDEVRALRRAVPLYDNVSAVSGTTSDLLCTIVTGTAREGRLLYSNDDMSTAEIKRPIGMTAVATPAGLRPDALRRLIICEVEPPARMLGDATVQAAFDAVHPGLLAAWCDAVAAVLAWLPYVPPPGGYHGVPAHAHVLAALDAAVARGDLPGWPGGLLDAYAANARQVRQQVASDDVLGSALLALLARRPVASTRTEAGRVYEFREWKGQAAELLAVLNASATLADQRAPGWPATPRAMPPLLKQLAGPLSEVGLICKTRSLDGRTRWEFTLGSEKQDGA
jgi:hypothetical protein